MGSPKTVKREKEQRSKHFPLQEWKSELESNTELIVPPPPVWRVQGKHLTASHRLCESADVSQTVGRIAVCCISAASL